MVFVGREIMEVDFRKHIQTIDHIVQYSAPIQFTWVASTLFDQLLFDDQFHDGVDVTWPEFFVIHSACVQLKHYHLEVLHQMFVGMRFQIRDDVIGIRVDQMLQAVAKIVVWRPIDAMSFIEIFNDCLEFRVDRW